MLAKFLEFIDIYDDTYDFNLFNNLDNLLFIIKHKYIPVYIAINLPAFLCD